MLEAVPVDGGDLAVASWGPERGTTVLAAHGITSSHVFWELVGRRLAARGVRLLAPDLRGRGRSALLPGASIRQHATDLLALTDQHRVVVVGHSMGGFVAAVAARLRPDRVRHLVLVDGGPPMTPALPPDADVEAAVHGVIGPALERLDRTFPDREAYRGFWRAHPAVGQAPADLLDAYADHDLVRDEEGGWRSGVDRDAVIGDARDLMVDRWVREAAWHVDCPVTFLVAARGMLDDPRPLYGEEAVAELRRRLPHAVVRVVPDTNHYTIGMSLHGADAIAAAVTEAATGQE